MTDKRDLDAKKRAQVERLQQFGEHMKARLCQGERIPLWQTRVHPAFPVVLDILRQDGRTTADLDKPLIGIANSFSEVTPGHTFTPPRLLPIPILTSSLLSKAAQPSSISCGAGSNLRIS